MRQKSSVIPIRTLARLSSVWPCLAWAAVLVSPPASLAADTPVVERYVEAGLESNLALRQQGMEVSRALAVLDEARSLFRPVVSLEARYSRAGGGRDIEFPVGDLLNPVYGTLNELLVGQGEDPRFGSIENVSIPFLREVEQDTRIRLAQPIYQPALRPNLEARRSSATVELLGYEVFRRELIRDIKQSYFEFLQASRFVEIADATAELVEETLRTNRALYERGSITRDEVLRLEAELASVQQQRLEAERARVLAASYVNFLLNRALDTPLEVDAALREPEPLQESASVPRAAKGEGDVDYAPAERRFTSEALERREELSQLDAATRAAEATLRIATAERRPGLNLVLDYGIQGVNYGIQSEDDFWQGSLVLSWRFWNSGQVKARRNRARRDVDRLELRRREAQQEISLEVRDAWRRLEVARRSVEVESQRVRSAAEAYRITSRRYEAGVVPQVSLTDARTELTRARVGLSAAFYGRLAQEAELERAVAGAVLPALPDQLGEELRDYPALEEAQSMPSTADPSPDDSTSDKQESNR